MREEMKTYKKLGFDSYVDGIFLPKSQGKAGGKVGLKVSSIPASKGSGIHTIVEWCCFINSFADKETCYEVNANVKVL